MFSSFIHPEKLVLSQQLMKILTLKYLLLYQENLGDMLHPNSELTRLMNFFTENIIYG